MKTSQAADRAPTVSAPRATHEMNSGMGGVFFVRIIEDHGDYYTVKTVMRGSDFHNKTINVKKTDLRPLT